MIYVLGRNLVNFVLIAPNKVVDIEAAQALVALKQVLTTVVVKLPLTHDVLTLLRARVNQALVVPKLLQAMAIPKHPQTQVALILLTC